jgi:hypothetical protein
LIPYIVSLYEKILNKKAAVEQAQKWIDQLPSPKELDPDDVSGVLEALGFEFKGKNANHTTYRWFHVSLNQKDGIFKFGIVSISIGHSKKSKKVVRIDSVSKLLDALELYIKWNQKNEKR